MAYKLERVEQTSEQWVRPVVLLIQRSGFISSH